MTARRTPELNLHYSVAELLGNLASKDVIWWHTANGNVGARYGAKLKRMGVKPGVPDFTILIPTPTTDFGGGRDPMVAFLELKAGKGVLSEPQKLFRDAVDRIGCFHHVSYDYDDAVKWLRNMGAIKRNIRVAA